MMLFYLALSIEWQILIKFITWFVDLINQINCKVLDTSIFAMKMPQIIIFVCFGLCFWIGPIGWGIRVIYVLTWTMQVREGELFWLRGRWDNLCPLQDFKGSGPMNVCLCRLGQPHSVRMWTFIRMYVLTAFTHSLQTRPEWHQFLFQNVHSRIHPLLLFKISLWLLLPIGKKVKKIPNISIGSPWSV